MFRRNLVIAIDGPAASGKSTTARIVARRLGYTYIDTGAMYRAVTLAVLRARLDPADQDAVENLAHTLSIRFRPEGPTGALHTLLNGEDVSREIRTPEVTRHVSLVSSYPGVREAMVTAQRRIGSQGGVVLDGRDIGTVVFPDADVKVFMVADIEARAIRRSREMAEEGGEVAVDSVAADLERRDQFDSSRAVSPLQKASDAVEIDTSDLSIDDQVEIVLDLAHRRLDS